MAPDTLVIHCISLPPGEYGTRHVRDLFLGCLDCSAHPEFESLKGIRVSVHLVIDRKGAIQQFVPFDRAAWHAGESQLGNRTSVNDFSIGIELEGLPGEDFTDQQYSALAEVTRALFAAYPELDRGRIAGHCDIAPDRKTDPGPGFDWKRYFALIG